VLSACNSTIKNYTEIFHLFCKGNFPSFECKFKVKSQVTSFYYWQSVWPFRSRAHNCDSWPYFNFEENFGIFFRGESTLTGSRGCHVQGSQAFSVLCVCSYLCGCLLLPILLCTCQACQSGHCAADNVNLIYLRQRHVNERMPHRHQVWTFRISCVGLRFCLCFGHLRYREFVWPCNTCLSFNLVTDTWTQRKTIHTFLCNGYQGLFPWG